MKYVNRGEIIKAVKEAMCPMDCPPELRDSIAGTIVSAAESIDIVHCTDCKYMKPKKDPLGYLVATCEYTRWNTIHSKGFENCGAVTADDYCSYGEKKDETD